MSAVRYAVDLILGRVPVPVACDACTTTRTHITQNEAALLAVHHRLLCPCGGQLQVAVLDGGTR